LAGIFREGDNGDEGELGSNVAVPGGWVNFGRRHLRGRPAQRLAAFFVKIFLTRKQK
jgi:hypothetical protein